VQRSVFPQQGIEESGGIYGKENPRDWLWEFWRRPGCGAQPRRKAEKLTLKFGEELKAFVSFSPSISSQDTILSRISKAVSRPRFLKPQVSVHDNLPNHIISGRMMIKSSVKEFMESDAIFEDDAVTIIDNQISLWHRVFPLHLEKPTLAFIGLIQPVVIPATELQSRWVTCTLKAVRWKFSLDHAPYTSTTSRDWGNGMPTWFQFLCATLAISEFMITCYECDRVEQRLQGSMSLSPLPKAIPDGFRWLNSPHLACSQIIDD
ncbi:hypothetical protein HPG69_010636, partial [Diceros bicornis minor]